MEIMIWSDFVCPFCYIGGAHLDQALEETGLANKVEIEYKSFLLNPTAKYDPSMTYVESFSKDKGMPEETSRKTFEQISNMAAQSNLELNFETAKYAGTFDAHRVFHYAKSEGKGNDYFQRFYRAHFNDGLDVSNFETIADLASEVGLDRNRALEVLENNEYDTEVKQDFQQAQALEVQGVPFFVLDRKYAISGAQPVESFVQGLQKAWDEHEAAK